MWQERRGLSACGEAAFASVAQDENASKRNKACGAHRPSAPSAPLRLRAKPFLLRPSANARRRTRDNAIITSANGRRPVRLCSSRTSVAARLSLRTPDGESHETVRSALRHRGATVRARVLAVMPCGLAPLPDAGADKLPLPMSFGGAALAPQAFSKKMRQRRAPSTGRQAGARSEALTAHRTRCGRHMTDMVRFVKVDRQLPPKPRPSPRT